MTTELAPRATIGQLVGIRDLAIRRYAALLTEAKEINDLAAQLNLNSWRSPSITVQTSRHSYDSTAADAYRRQLDAAAWDHLLERTELRDLMSAKQKADWQAQLDKDPPEFTLETAVATFEDFRARSGEIFRQGLVDVFEALPRDFRSHDGFKLGARCVMGYAVSHHYGRFSWQYSSYSREPRAQLGDLDRTFHALAGEEWTVNASDVMAKAMADGNAETETRFFRLRWFKNGNLHVWFTDADMTRRANKLLAEHYGPKLGQMHLHPDQRRAA